MSIMIHHIREYARRLILVAILSAMVPAVSYAQNAPSYTQQQLDQMLAPIALYPDPLVAQILMASTYPLEVVEAQRWLQQPGNAAIRGDQLSAALEQQPWDPSVKSLVPFPQIVKMMDSNLQWTEQMGDAFLADQGSMMDSVQRLRQQAQAAGTLQSTPQEVVSSQGPDIEIEPANPQVVYVPYYNPQTAYGTWLYPDYPPVYFAQPAGYTYYDDGLFFGIGIGVLAPFWGWDHWDWNHHRINIDDDRFRRINRDRPPVSSGHWEHDPAHRHGIPYRAAPVRTLFPHASDEARRSYRGYNPQRVATPMAPHEQNFTRPQTQRVERTNIEQARQPAVVLPGSRPAAPQHAEQPHEQPRVEQPHVAQPHRAAPMFESFSRGRDVREQAQRGAASRAPAPRAPENRPAPAHEDHGRGGDDHRK